MIKTKLSLIACALLGTAVYLAPLSLASVTNSSFAGGYAHGQEEEKKPARKLKRVPTLRGKVYEQLARAQKLGDEGNVAGAIEILDEARQSQFHEQLRSCHDAQLLRLRLLQCRRLQNGI